MLIAKVRGNVVSTRKVAELVGYKLMIVENIDDKKTYVAIDTVGSGIGETVLVTIGSAAMQSIHPNHAPIDAAIVGIVDEA